MEERLCQGQHMPSPVEGGGRGMVKRSLEALEPSKRPAAAVWGNGLWGSVGAAGRSYD